MRKTSASKNYDEYGHDTKAYQQPPHKTRDKIVALISFALIVLAGVFLRFDRLTTIPPSLSHDEAAIAYNAYSVLKTGKDEYGIPFPLLFRSFDDYKLPGMVYATVPFVALFGRTELAARLPSAIFGTLAIIVMYGLAIELLGTKRWLKFGSWDVDGALFPALMLAIQPWHVNFSRQLFESNGATFWFMLGTYLLLRSRKRYGYLLWAGLSYVVSLYFYYSVRLVIPFVALLYVFLQWRIIVKQWKATVVIVILCFIAFLPMGREMLSPGGWQRINTVSVVNDPDYITKRAQFVSILGTHPTTMQKILYNRRVALLITIIDNYGKNIAPHNLFVTGTGTYGALYPFEMILLPIGFIYVFSLAPLASTIVLTWLITGFLPGAFSINQPNTLRTLIAAPVFALLSGFGLYYGFALLRKWKLGAWLFAGLMLIAFVVTFPNFLYAYFVNNPTNNAVAFADGTKQMVAYVKANEGKYDRIYISGYYWRPYIFMLYWGGIDPVAYQNGGNREHFGKYYFTSASWDTNGIKLMDPSFDFKSLPHDGRTLYILSYPEYQLLSKYVHEISAINGRNAPHVFIAVEMK